MKNSPKVRQSFSVTRLANGSVIYIDLSRPGQLIAAEAINVLVENLDETGRKGLIISIHFRPVPPALARIGEPAVPRLVRALSDPKKSIRTEAAWTLFQNQGVKAKAALESAYNNEKDEDAKADFKDVLERMNAPKPISR